MQSLQVKYFFYKSTNGRLGFVPSKMSDQLLTYGDEASFAAMTTLGRIGNPKDMAGVVLYLFHSLLSFFPLLTDLSLILNRFLASEASAWVTGAVIKVDGGQLVKPASAL